MKKQQRQGQEGLSLIGLMVGLLISMLAILAAVTLYKNTVKTVYGEKGLVRNAVQDGQLAAGLMSAQIALQSAGYGLDLASSDKHLLLLASASLNSQGSRLSGTPLALGEDEQSSNALIWMFDADPSPDRAQLRCQALLSNPETGALKLLQSQGNCQPLGVQWNKISWRKTVLIEPDILATPVQLSVARDLHCWPFGSLPQAISQVSEPRASVAVRLHYVGSVEQASNTYTSCLANLGA
ncbi:hypothetical protein DBR47_13260 [Paucibacter sp. KBW04]|uniref:PilW family protein n=1 Tax=Paucibacter sp. KBW04 TaxID=2153361 RepID=UPI000F56EB4F|nr:hypothetical protein [Paucibacter sp. KBW04]RQO58652.1 hypothetical protein DBR47_13260 [Paucibacter sp. KBW04]